MIERHLANGAGVGAGGHYNAEDYQNTDQYPAFPPNAAHQQFDLPPTDQYYDTGAPGTFSVGDYATMDRGSVTPFQAAQYAAISEQLQSQVGQQQHQVYDEQHQQQHDAYDQYGGAYNEQQQYVTGQYVPTEQWNSGSPFEDPSQGGVQPPQSIYQTGAGAAPVSMPYDFPMTPSNRLGPDDPAQYGQARAQSPPSLGTRKEPTGYNVSSRSSPRT
jgi:hypothetical protein